ncbi:MAG: hypothetical protein RR880_00910, partial [Bacteroidales bacterium]
MESVGGNKWRAFEYSAFAIVALSIFAPSALVIAIILYFTLRKTDAEVPKEEAKTEEKQGAGIKEVELNEAQFTGSKIELGGFSQKNLSDVINANGY